MGKKKVALLDLDDPEEAATVEGGAAAGGDAAEAAAGGEQQAAAPRAKKKDKKGSKKGKKAAFDSDEEEPAGQQQPGEGGEDEDSAPAVLSKPKAKGGSKSKASAARAAFSLLAEDGEDEAAEQEEQQAGEDEEGDEPAPAPAKPAKKEGKKKKTNAASLFAALADANGEEEGGGPEVVEAEAAAAQEGGEEEAPAKKKGDKKAKKGSKDVASLFAALEVNEGDADAAGGEEGAAALIEKKEKKKKAPKDAASLFAALDEGADEKPAAEATAAAAGGDAELDALMEELKPSKPAEADSKKKKKKGKAAKDKADEEDIDALLAALDGPKQPAPPKEPAPAAPAAAPAAAAAAAAEGAAEGAKAEEEEEEGEGGEDVEAMAAQGKELTAAQKRKLKKKQREKEKKAAGGKAEGEEGEEAPKKGGKPMKENAATKRIREEMERRRKAEEEARREEEEQRALEEAEARAEAEEEARKEEERMKKKERERAKREQLRKEGKLLTGKAKAEADRLALVRAQMLKQAEERGISIETAEAEAADKKPKKVVYTTKKSQKKKEDTAKEEEEARAQQEAAEKEALREKEEEEKAAAKAAAAAAAAAAEAPAAAGAEDGGDDWEAAADDWETMDLDAVKVPGQPAPEPPAPAPAAAPAPAPAAAASKAAPLAAAASKAAPAAASRGAAAAKGAVPSKAQAAAAAAKAEQAKAAAAKRKKEEEEEESGSSKSGSDEDEDSSSGSGSDDTSSEESESESESETDSSDDETTDSEASDDERIQATRRRIAEAKARRLERGRLARVNANKEELRSPICCILGHVDVGKTKILDNIRRTNVQDGEAGGITQQIGATFIPAESVEKRTAALRSANNRFDMRLPGLLVIDTPGHESFTNLRARGSGLCDIAVLCVDLMHGLEQQTIESINMLRMRKTPFIIALNKVDRLYNWKTCTDAPIRDSFKRQKEHVITEFDQRSSQVFLQLNELGLNVALYWKNTDPRSFVNVVPTSAITGEGLPDLLQLMVKLTQTMMADRLMFVDNPEATVLEVKHMTGLGTTVDCVLVNGKLRDGDKIILCGLSGPIVTRIKALKTPQVMKEMRVKGELMDHKEVSAAIGVKVVAPGLESAVAGTQMFVVTPEDDEDELKEAAMADMADIFSKVDKGGEGVCVQASTLGSLEALLTFLSTPDVNINVSGINLGAVHKKDVLRANVMNEKGARKFAVILAFDVPVSKEARELADEFNVKIFTADIIYHLFDQFTAYVKQFKQTEQEAARYVAVFPCVLKIIPTCIFNKKDPIVLGVEVEEGIAKVGTPICVPSQGNAELGRITSMELNHKSVDVARAGQSVAMKIEASTHAEQGKLYGRHFDHTDPLVSLITRESINALKTHFRDDMTKDDWRLVIKLKNTFKIS